MQPDLRRHMNTTERREYDAARKVTDSAPDAFKVKHRIERRVRARLRRAKAKADKEKAT